MRGQGAILSPASPSPASAPSLLPAFSYSKVPLQPFLLPPFPPSRYGTVLKQLVDFYNISILPLYSVTAPPPPPPL